MGADVVDLHGCGAELAEVEVLILATVSACSYDVGGGEGDMHVWAREREFGGCEGGVVLAESEGVDSVVVPG